MQASESALQQQLSDTQTVLAQTQYGLNTTLVLFGFIGVFAMQVEHREEKQRPMLFTACRHGALDSLEGLPVPTTDWVCLLCGRRHQSQKHVVHSRKVLD